MGNLTPIGNKVLIELPPKQDFSRGGIALPDTAKERDVMTGTVVDVGFEVDFDIVPGVTVVFHPYAGTKFDLEGTKHIVVNEEDVLAILEDS